VPDKNAAAGNSPTYFPFVIFHLSFIIELPPSPRKLKARATTDRQVSSSPPCNRTSIASRIT
jgi:hypothetical protein